MISLFILCYFLLNISINSLIGAEKIAKTKAEEIETIEDVVMNDNVIPCIYGNGAFENRLKVQILMNMYLILINEVIYI